MKTTHFIDRRFTASKQIGGIWYDLIVCSDLNNVHVEFTAFVDNEHSVAITRTGNTFAVFTWVIDELTKLTNTETWIETIYFEAEEPSRQKLYRRIVDRTCSNTLWICRHDNERFLLTRGNNQ